MNYVIKKGGVYWPSAAMKKTAWVKNDRIYKEADKDPVKFWEKAAREEIDWDKKWTKAYEENLPFFKWFIGAKLNISYNSLDRHLKKKANKIALIWVPEPVDEKPVKLTYKQLHESVCRFANVLLKLGVKKGDVVSIYLPLIPEVIISMLACARIGAIHSVVFSAFSSQALKIRIQDGQANLLITADGYFRKGVMENLKSKADEAVQGTQVQKMIVVKRLNSSISLGKNQFWFHELMKDANSFCKPVSVDSEHPLYILYTSGTTGTPKGVIHDTGGYAVGAAYTSKLNFNLHENDITWCTADIGWVTGHTYLCYGTLLNGVTTVMYEGSPDYPDPGRFWKIINENKVSVFYTAPTALRMFRFWGDKWIPKNLDSLKILGTVGEPIDTDTWLWYFDKIGRNKLPIIDTWWQTETGTHMINSLPGVGPFIPAVAGKSFPGIRHGVIDNKGNFIKEGNGLLVQLSPFAPPMLRGVWRNPEKYREKYWMLEETKTPVRFYITGDSAVLHKDGTIRILGRSDDVIKVAGHRLSTAELEDVAHNHVSVGDVAVVSKPDPIKGEAIVIFIRLKKQVQDESKIKEEIVQIIVKQIGPIAKPQEIYFVDDLPKTRSGKIMRRILKSLLRNEELGDLSTIVNPECINDIKGKIVV